VYSGKTLSDPNGRLNAQLPFINTLLVPRPRPITSIEPRH
jgi:hypothetical protein